MNLRKIKIGQTVKVIVSEDYEKKALDIAENLLKTFLIKKIKTESKQLTKHFDLDDSKANDEIMMKLINVLEHKIR